MLRHSRFTLKFSYKFFKSSHTFHYSFISHTEGDIVVPIHPLYSIPALTRQLLHLDRKRLRCVFIFHSIYLL